MKNILALFLILTSSLNTFAQVDGGSTLIAEETESEVIQEQIQEAQKKVLEFTNYLLKKESKCGNKTGIASSGSILKEIHLKLLAYETTNSSPKLCQKRDQLFSCFRNKQYDKLLDKMVSSPGFMPYLIQGQHMNKKEVLEMVSFFRKLGQKNSDGNK